MNKGNWQKHFRYIPDAVLKKLHAMGDKIVVAGVKKVSASELNEGKYTHLGMTIKNGSPAFAERITPNPMNGKYSMWNVHGREIVRKDLPMVTKTFTAETPNWGDWSNGSHEIEWDRDVYQREFVPPKGLEISITLLESEGGQDPVYVFRFSTEEILEKGEKDFPTSLFFNINLLQENVGIANVFAAEAPTSEYLKTISVMWEILPPGERNEILNRVLSKFREPSPALKQKLEERYGLLSKLKPVAYISGTSGFQRYFGAQFKDDLVVFENLEYGNAVYVMFENWEELSKLSRIELLKSRKTGFERIVHRTGWQQVLISLIKSRRGTAA